MKRLYIANGQTTVRQMLAEVIGGAEFEIVGESGDGLVALDEIVKSKPDVVLTDISLPGLSGIDLLRGVAAESSETKVVIFSDEYGNSIVSDALKAGARGFVETSVKLSELRRAIEVVSNGGSYFGPKIASVIRSVVTSPEKQDQGKDALTQREREVLQLIALGNSTKAIAQKLELSVKTIDNHRSSLMRKLNFHNIADITRYAMENRLIEVNFND